MSNVIANLLPLILGAAFLPLWIIVTLVLLRGKGGLAKAAAFLAGAMTVRVLQFILFSRVFGAIVSAEGSNVFDLVASTLLLVAGLVLLITAVKTWWWRREDDPDAPPPKSISVLDSISALKAFGMAIVVMAVALKPWVFTLSAIAIIDEEIPGKVESVLAYLFFVLGAHSLMLAPIIVSAIAPSHAAKTLAMMLTWLERKNRVITIVCSLVFGTWFIWKGMSGLLAHGGPPKLRAN